MRTSAPTDRRRQQRHHPSSAATAAAGFASLRGTDVDDDEQPRTNNFSYDSTSVNTTGSLSSRRPGGPSNKTDDGDDRPDDNRTVGGYDETVSQTTQSISIASSSSRFRYNETVLQTRQSPSVVSNEDTNTTTASQPLASDGIYQEEQGVETNNVEETRDQYGEEDSFSNVDDVADFKDTKSDRPSKSTDDGDPQPDIQQRHDETASQRRNVSMAPSLPEVVSTPRIFSGEYLPRHGAYAVAGPGGRSNTDGRASPVTNPSYNGPAEQEEEEEVLQQQFVVVGTATAVEPDDRTQLLQELHQEVEELRARNRELEDVQGVRGEAVVIASEEGETRDATTDNDEEPHGQETPVQEEAGKGSRQLDNEIFINRAHRWIGMNRWLCIGIAVVLILGAIVGIAAGVSSSQSKGGGEPSSLPTISTPRPTPQPTRPPTARPSLRPTQTPIPTSSDPTTALIQANALDGGKSLNDPSSPQYQALQWLLGNSELSTHSDRRKLQRYSLATLYYSTNGVGWTNLTGWLTDSHECTWWSDTSQGLLCSDGEFVSNLDLNPDSPNNIVGTLPEELALFSSSLVKISFGNNSLSGAIPSEIGLLTSLEILYMWGNDLSSTIPSELGLLTKMESLGLSNNKLTGTIPSDLSGMTKLRWLSLFNNTFIGTIPSKVSGMTNLEELSLSDNTLTGTIPSEVKGMTNLERLFLRKNALTGTIPSEIDEMANLKLLSLSNNKLMGTIPSDLSGMTNLAYLVLHNNELTGTIPSEINEMTNLNELWLYNNNLLPPFTCPSFIGWCAISCSSGTSSACREL